MNATAAASGSAAARVYAFASAVFLLVAPATATPGWRVAALIVAALALVASIARREAPVVPLAWPRALVAWYAAWAALAALSFLWSASVDYSMSEWRREILYGALAFGVFYAGTADAQRWRQACVILMAGVALLAVAEAARNAFGWGTRSFNGGPGRFTTHLVIVLPLIACLVSEPPLGFGRRPALAAAALGVAFLAALAAGNRIVWIAFLAAFVVLALLARPPGPRSMRRDALAIGLVAAILVLFALSIEQKAREFYPELGSGQSIARDLRPKLWALAAEAAAERPLLGHGYGHEILADRYRAAMGGQGEFATHGHNMFLDAAVSLGFTGLAILVAMFATLALAYRRLLANAATRLLGAIGLAMLAAFVVKNLTDDFFVRQNALVFWAMNGMLLGLGHRMAAARAP
jgi:O-antigen ligase